MQQTPNKIWISGNRALDLRRSFRRLEVAAIALLGAVMVWGASQSIRPAAGQDAPPGVVIVPVPTVQYRLLRITCVDREIARLIAKNKRKEVTEAAGMTNGGSSLVEVMTTPDGATWSITMTTGELTCIVGSGTDWLDLPRAPIVVGDPS